MENSLAYNSELENLHKRKSLLETTIDQCHELRKEDASKKPCDVDMHVGVLSFKDFPSGEHQPCTYTLNEFLSQREKLLAQCKSRFSQLRDRAKSYGLGTLVETCVAAAIAPMPASNYIPTMMYFPFSDLESIRAISNDRITFDAAHWAIAQNISIQFEQNKADEERKFLFTLENINTWEEHLSRNPGFQEYLPYAKAFHLSNATGCGVFLDKHPDLQRRWGDSGTIEGIIPKKDLQRMVTFAQEKDIPVILEVDFDIPKIKDYHFNEADPFLRYLLEQ